MHVTCSRCLRSLSTADPNGPPMFCMYCGQKLQDSNDDTRTSPGPPPQPGDRTASFVPFGPDPDVDPGPLVEEVGGYRLVRLLGAGGMGAVYEAEPPGGGDRVAVKLLSPRLASSPTSVERFKQEGRLASLLAHPRCVFVLAADTDAGRPYIVMELMPGRTLKDLVDQKGPLPPTEAVGHVLDAIDGLAEAHRIGVLHRDIKPSNFFLTADDRVKVGDFGLSKSLAGSSERHLTQTGAFLGTVLFASPEQIKGEPLDYGTDIYSLCATLYFLLTGEAPYQHESVTAALAKAISEPPPPIRGKRPEVGRSLERVVLKGLERDRDRRWQSLDELRDALVSLLPGRQIPARPRTLVGAYLLDGIVLILFGMIPAEVGEAALGLQQLTVVKGVTVDPTGWVLGIAYFAVFEGIFGRAVGKALLGLRVRRVGAAGPPGLGRGLVRAAAFSGLWFWLFIGTEVAGEFAGGLAALAAFVLGVAALVFQLRRTKHGFRGLHDFASGCHVTQRPLPVRKLRLVSKRGNRLDAVEPADPAAPLPETVGGYAVRGRLWADDTGEQVWSADDRALGRRVLLWFRPVGESPLPPAPAEVARPTRLRRLGAGKLRFIDRDLEWTAFAAPVGSPLTDAVRPDRPLPWADARHLIEQLVDELQAAEADGSTPARLELDQVWVEPTGRVQVVDCPMARTREPLAASHPVGLLRQVASLTLEGTPRDKPYPRRRGRAEPGVRAPVPPHASPILTRLFAPKGYKALGELHRDLLDTHGHSPEVTPSIRAAQLGIQAATLAPGLVFMFLIAGIVAVVLSWVADLGASQATKAAAALRDPETREKLAAKKLLQPALNNPATAARLDALHDINRADADARRAALLAPQRFLRDRFPEPHEISTGVHSVEDETRDALIVWAGDNEPVRNPMRGLAPQFWIAVGVIPLAWVLAAVVFRGGLSMALTGVALVRADGRKATRRQCALRAFLVWLPVTGLLMASIWVQVRHPEWAYTHAGLWLLAAALLPVYVVVALKNPARPPQDRIAGTHLVPA